jgi:hypothetical protein
MASLPPFPWATTLRKTEEILGFCQKVAEFLRAVSKLQILDGQFVQASFVASKSPGLIRHTLGRPYNGAWVVSTTNPGSAPMISVLPPLESAQAGIDPAVYLAMGAQAAWTGTAKLWVF